MESALVLIIMSASLLATEAARSELLAEATVVEDGKGACQTPQCNAGKCGISHEGAGLYNVSEEGGKVMQITSLFCQKAFGEESCCLEYYGKDNYLRLHKAGGSATPAQICKSCTPLKGAQSAVKAGTVNLFFMRHAEGCHNLGKAWHEIHDYKNLVFGNYDAPLTDAGVHQAHLAADHLRAAGASIDHVLVSPMLRAQQTYLVAAAGVQQLADKVPAVCSFACETGKLYSGHENTPAEPIVQECLMREDNAAAAAVWKQGHIKRCPIWHTLNPFSFNMETCTHGEKPAYEAESKMVKPQEFADWLTMEFPGQTVLLVGHSNWANLAGIRRTTGEKVYWASLSSLVVEPGYHIKDSAVTEHYAGTPRNAGTQGSVRDEPRCMAYKQYITTCNAPHDWQKGL